MRLRLRLKHVHTRTRESIYLDTQDKVIDPNELLKTRLEDLCEQNNNKYRRLSTFSRSSDCTDMKVVRELLVVLKREEKTDHIVSIIGRLNQHCEGHRLSSDLANLLGMFFSMYEQYRVYFNDALLKQLLYFDVWKDNVTAYLDALIEGGIGFCSVLDRYRNYFSSRQLVAIIRTINNNIDKIPYYDLIDAIPFLAAQEFIPVQLRQKIYERLKQIVFSGELINFNTAKAATKALIQLNMADQLLTEGLTLLDSQPGQDRNNAHCAICNLIEIIPVSSRWPILERLLGYVDNINLGTTLIAAYYFSIVLNKIPPLPDDQASQVVQRLLPLLDDSNVCYRYLTARALCALPKSIPEPLRDKFIKSLLILSDSGLGVKLLDDDTIVLLGKCKHLIPPTVLPLVYNRLIQFCDRSVAIDTLCEMYYLLPQDLQARFFDDALNQLKSLNKNRKDIFLALLKWQSIFPINARDSFICLLGQVLLDAISFDDQFYTNIYLNVSYDNVFELVTTLCAMLKHQPQNRRAPGIKILQEASGKDPGTKFYKIPFVAMALIDLGVNIGIDEVFKIVLSGLNHGSQFIVAKAQEHAEVFLHIFSKEMRSSIIDALLAAFRPKDQNFLIDTIGQKEVNTSQKDNKQQYSLLHTLHHYRNDMSLGQIVSVLSRMQTLLQKNCRADKSVTEVMVDMYETYRQHHVRMLLQRVPTESHQRLPGEMAEEVARLGVRCM